MDRASFFAAVRSSVFGGSLAQPQVDGMNAILDACGNEQVADARCVAYGLATPMIETGGTFLTKSESLNYSVSGLQATFGKRISSADAAKYGRSPQHAADQQAIANIVYGGDWGRQNLGNTEANDGWDFRGRGLCQITGRANYAKFSPLVGVDLVANPDAAKDIEVAAKIMIVGMRDGLFRNRRFANYFTQSESDWIGARGMINGGGDRATDIAAYARKFYNALQAS